VLSSPRIHVFGDSNALYNFTNEIIQVPQSQIYTVHQKHFYSEFQVEIPFFINGFISKTMHGVAKEGFLNFQNYGVLDGDVVVLVYGCVDVYYNIAKQRDERHRELEEILETLVMNYFRFILRNREQFQNLTCIIVSVLPPCIGITGELEDKKNITLQLNKKLSSYANLFNMEYLDVHDFYIAEEGHLDPQLSDGSHHVAMENNYPIRQNLLKLLLKKCCVKFTCTERDFWLRGNS
jgi:hypothetical protein